MIQIIRKILLKRNLIYELVRKDFKVRYQNPRLGFFWFFWPPLVMVFVLYFVFDVFLKAKTEEVPFVLYLMSGVFTWRLFQDSLVMSTTSLVDNRNLGREPGFTYYLIPLSIVLINCFNFFPFLLILISVAFIMLKGLPFLIILLPFVLILHVILTIGLSLICSILFVRNRDIKYILETLLLFLFYASPVFYSTSLVKLTLNFGLFKAYMYNPFTAILTLYRMVLLKGYSDFIGKDINLWLLFSSALFFAIVMFVLGYYLHTKNRKYLNDYLFY